VYFVARLDKLVPLDWNVDSTLDVVQRSAAAFYWNQQLPWNQSTAFLYNMLSNVSHREELFVFNTMYMVAGDVHVLEVIVSDSTGRKPSTQFTLPVLLTSSKTAPKLQIKFVFVCYEL
jgi:hypothetical protein